MADHPLPAGGNYEALNARGLAAKREYVRGLEQRRDPEALSLLVECLCDESWFLRDLAEQTFVRLGEEHAGPLLPMLTGGLWYTRLSTARLLGRLGYRPAVPALLELCVDTNEMTALAARDALASVARQRGSSRIAHALHRLPPDRKRDRLAEIAQRDRALAKNIERLMTDAGLMSSVNPDRLVDEEGDGTAGAKAAPKAAVAPAPRSTKPAAGKAPTPKPSVVPAPEPSKAAVAPPPSAPVPDPKPPAAGPASDTASGS